MVRKKGSTAAALALIVSALEGKAELLQMVEEQSDLIKTLKAEKEKLEKQLAVLTGAFATLNGKSVKSVKVGMKRGKHRGRPKGSKNKAVKAVKAVKKVKKPKTVKAVKKAVKTVKAVKKVEKVIEPIKAVAKAVVKPKTVKTAAPVVALSAPKTETATVPATVPALTE